METRPAIAAWVPGWYELDPPLEVGMNDDFVFWRTVPEHLRGPEPLVLYNTLWHPQDAMVARGTIAAIRHPTLGDVQKVDTRGLSYTITLVVGTELIVEAEEEPGTLYERAGDQWVRVARQVADWRFIVEFLVLAEPTPAE